MEGKDERKKKRNKEEGTKETAKEKREAGQDALPRRVRGACRRS